MAGKGAGDHRVGRLEAKADGAGALLLVAGALETRRVGEGEDLCWIADIGGEGGESGPDEGREAGGLGTVTDDVADDRDRRAVRPVG